ncbi:hypothetical protein EDB80DRAFT_717661 [Ilyonectria destructans]|nr:hypothetical protein EDB80DRAFT_717661 [Ilyonectria destructans]
MTQRPRSILLFAEKISGKEEYAETAANILIAWAEKLEFLSGGGDDDYHTAGL